MHNSYQRKFDLLANSGKIKSELKIVSEVRGIQHYTLLKLVELNLLVINEVLLRDC